MKIIRDNFELSLTNFHSPVYLVKLIFHKRENIISPNLMVNHEERCVYLRTLLMKKNEARYDKESFEQHSKKTVRVLTLSKVF